MCTHCRRRKTSDGRSSTLGAVGVMRCHSLIASSELIAHISPPFGSAGRRRPGIYTPIYEVRKRAMSYP